MSIQKSHLFPKVISDFYPIMELVITLNIDSWSDSLVFLSPCQDIKDSQHAPLQQSHSISGSQEQFWQLKLCSRLPWCQQSGISPQHQAQQHAADQSWRSGPESRAARWGSSCRHSRSWNLEETGTKAGSGGRNLEEKKNQWGVETDWKRFSFLTRTVLLELFKANLILQA